MEKSENPGNKTGIKAGSKESAKIELKERFDVDRLRDLLNNWVKALDDKADLELEVGGEKKRVPYEAYGQGRVEVEVEWKNGENEFEIELKWPGRPEDTLLKQ